MHVFLEIRRIIAFTGLSVYQYKFFDNPSGVKCFDYDAQLPPEIDSLTFHIQVQGRVEKMEKIASTS